NLAPDSAEPGLWGHLAAGTHMDSAVIHVRKVSATDSIDYATYTLGDVTISSFTTDEERGGVRQDAIKLHFGKIEESYSELDDQGAPGTPDKARFDVKQGLSDGDGDLAPGASTAVAPVLGLTLVEGGVTLREEDILGYSWGATSTGGAPSLQDVTINLGATAAEPGFWGHLAANTHLDRAVIHLRKASPDKPTEYATYTLTDVTISSFTTDEERGGVPQDAIKLHFGKIEESYSELDDQGAPGTPDKARFDVKQGLSD